MTSQRKRLFNWFTDTLNQNTQNVNFSGNFVFKFYGQQQGVSDFEIISTNENSLDFESTEIVPVVNISSIEIPYVEKNNRSDFEQEYYVALRIENRIDETTNQMVLEFDDTDPKYQALLETIDTIRNQLSFAYDGFKFTVKAKEPQVVQSFKYNGNYYTLFAITLNMSAISDGFYGNEMTFRLSENLSAFTDDDILDVVEANIIVGKETFQRNNITLQPTDQLTEVASRTFQAQLTVNYRGEDFDPDEILFDELLAENTSLINKVYRFGGVQGNNTFTHNVVITSVNASFRNNSVETISFQVERAE